MPESFWTPTSLDLLGSLPVRAALSLPADDDIPHGQNEMSLFICQASSKNSSENLCLTPAEFYLTLGVVFAPYNV